MGTRSGGSEISVPTLISRIKQINREYSENFCLPDAQAERRWFCEEYPVGLFSFGCMDGRNNIPNATEIPLGVMKNFHFAGGEWHWWNNVSTVFSKDIARHEKKHRASLVLVSYHFSRSEKHLGCAWFNYDTDAAIKANLKFLKKIERVYGDKHKVVFPVLVGLETDEESLVIHDSNNHENVLRVADLQEYDENYLKTTLVQMFGLIEANTMKMLLRLIAGNINHVAKIRASHRPVIDLDHREWILAIGNGLDWFRATNQAIIIGMYSYNPQEAIKTAASVIEKNLRTGQISKEDGFVLLASSSFHSESGYEKTSAREIALEYMRFAKEIIAQHYPQLLEMMHPLVTITNLDDRKFIEVKDIDLD